MSYTIHKNVTIPPRSRYPFPQMEVGDTFFVPSTEYFRELTQTKIHAAARRYREKHNPKFRVRTCSTERDGQFTIAVLRIK